jgi:hypothetical protein
VPPSATISVSSLATSLIHASIGQRRVCASIEAPGNFSRRDATTAAAAADSPPLKRASA